MKSQAYDIMAAVEEEYWWYRARRRLVKMLLKRFSIDRGQKLLDVGCGSGLLLKELASDYRVSGLDSAGPAILFCRQKGLADVKVGEAERIPYGDDYFDAVLALDLLEHIGRPEIALEEMKRVLKPGGYMIIFVPAFDFLWGGMDELGNHYRRYNRAGLVKLLNKSELEIIKSSYFNFFLFLPILVWRTLNKLLSVSSVPEHAVKLGPLNGFFYFLMRIEIYLLKMIYLPIGVSLLVVGRKKNNI